MRTTNSKLTMPILINEILTEHVDQAFESARLRRNGVLTTRDLVSAKMLAELEASGDAMRFVDTNGRIAWKATPSLTQRLMDLRLDAEDDLEDV
jgi:hypothetical protein